MTAVQDKFTHGGNIYEILREAGSAKPLHDFSANINPLGMPQTVQAVIEQNLKALIHYPDPQAVELKQAIAAFYRVPEAALILGNGAVELLYVLFHAMRPRKVLIPVPSFGEYERAARAAQAKILYQEMSPEQDFQLDWQELMAKLPEADCLVLGNPNNPTGTFVPETTLRQVLLEAKKQNCFVVTDESFIDFVPENEKYTGRALLADHENLLILQSLTKMYAIPGLRLGFAMTNPALVKKMEWGKDPWNVNLLAQKAGIAALADSQYQADTIACIHKEKFYLWQELQKINGIKAYEPTVNFILLDVAGSGFTAEQFRQAMLAENILVRDCSNYPGLDGAYIRIAVKLREDNEILLRVMRKVLKGTSI